MLFVYVQISMSIPFFILISYIVGSKISTAALLTIGMEAEERSDDDVKTR